MENTFQPDNLHVSIQSQRTSEFQPRELSYENLSAASKIEKVIKLHWLINDKVKIKDRRTPLINDKSRRIARCQAYSPIHVRYKQEL